MITIMLHSSESGSNREHRKKAFRLLMIVVAVCMGFLFAGLWCFYCPIACVEPIRHDGPYRGRILDAETGEPIEGAVVAVIWDKQRGRHQRFGDAQEVVTNAEGKFHLPGQGHMILSSMWLPSKVYIVKAGYKHQMMNGFTPHMVQYDMLRTMPYEWKDGADIRLRKLVPGEMTLSSPAYSSWSYKRKLRWFEYEIKKNDRIYLKLLKNKKR